MFKIPPFYPLEYYHQMRNYMTSKIKVKIIFSLTTLENYWMSN